MTRNFFTPLRLLLALCVAFEHIFYFQAGYATSPFELGHTSLGYFAVNGFFIISGFLITGSAVRSASLATFARSRILRIMPALIVVSLILGLIIAPLLGELALPTYYSTGSLWVSILKLITLINTDPLWPGLMMEQSPFAGNLTGPIWTLRYEVLAYMATGFLLFLGLHKNKAVTIFAAVLVSLLFCLDLQTGIIMEFSATLGALVRFGSCYLYGVCAYMFAPYLKFGWKLALLGIIIGALIIYFKVPSGEILMNFALVPIIFAISFADFDAPNWLRPSADYSYGLYIFHWPIYQVLIANFNQAPIVPLLLFAGLPLAFMAAALSWHFLEKPCLKLKAKSALKPA